MTLMLPARPDRERGGWTVRLPEPSVVPWREIRIETWPPTPEGVRVTVSDEN